jgi:FAD/FMN-containing dehydrogenase
VITAAVLRLYPRPTATATAWLAIETPRHAVKLLARLRHSLGDRLTAFELISRDCVEAVLAHAPDVRDPFAQPHPWQVLVEFSDSGEGAALRERAERALLDCVNAGTLRDAVLAQSGEQARALWRIRETIPEAQFTNVKHDISVPVSRTPEFIERTANVLRTAIPEARPYVFGHVGDGNLHYNVGPPSLVARREAVNRIVYDAVAALGGSISAEHGLGQLKRAEIRRQKSALELELMTTLKHALDPAGLMNPGKLL